MPIVDDAVVESVESFEVSLGVPTGATLGDPTATVTIVDDDVLTLPVVSVADVEVGEGDGTVEVTVSLDRAVSGDVVVPWSTQDGSAVAPGDFVSSSGTLTISTGVSGAFTVPIVDDAVVESVESFEVSLGVPTGATLGDPTATVTIVDDDVVVPPNDPELSIEGASVYEGLGVARVVTLNVSIDSALTEDVSFRWFTVDGTARAGSDYQRRISQGGTIRAGQTSTTIIVRTYGDRRVEPDETFGVVITPITAGIGVADGVGTVTILDDDPQPTATIANASVVEGDNGTADMEFVVTFSKPIGNTSIVRWIASDITARRSLGDYSSSRGFVTIAPGETEATIVVKVNGDTRVEPNEQLRIRLTSVPYARVLTPTATGTIINDD